MQEKTKIKKIWQCVVRLIRPFVRPYDRPFVRSFIRPSVRPSFCPTVHLLGNDFFYQKPFSSICFYQFDFRFTCFFSFLSTAERLHSDELLATGRGTGTGVCTFGHFCLYAIQPMRCTAFLFCELEKGEKIRQRLTPKTITLEKISFSKIAN